ncbi:MAG: complex I NDUFA9 subunit family protein [bacterium JZ-2024 1]
MIVLVTGASGFVGSHLLSALLSKNHQVWGIARKQKKFLIERFPKVRWFFLDASSDFHPALPGTPDAIIHLIGIIRQKGGDTFEKAHILSTKNVVDFARRWKVKRFLYVSALGTRDNAPTHFHRTKREAEKIIRDSGLDWTIFRPSLLILGPGDRFSLWAKKWILYNYPIVPVLGGGKNMVQPVFVQDVISLLVRSLTKKESHGKIYEVGGPDALTFFDLLREYASVLGKKRIFCRVPLWIGYPFPFLGEHFPWLSPLIFDILRMMLKEDNVCDLNPLFQDFPIILTPLRLALTLTLYPTLAKSTTRP